MKLPRITAPSQGRTYIQQFYGLNNTPSCSEQEFSDMKNLTSDYFPAIAPRKRRMSNTSVDVPRGIIGKGYDAAYVKGSKLVYNGNEIEMNLDPDTDKQMVSMGAYICIFPDKVKYNTYDGKVSKMYVETIGMYRHKSMIKDGDTFYPIDDSLYTKGKPANPKNGDMYIAIEALGIDTYEAKLMEYNTITSAWLPRDLYQAIQLEAVPFFDMKTEYKAGDYIQISNLGGVPSYLPTGQTNFYMANGTYKIECVQQESVPVLKYAPLLIMKNPGLESANCAEILGCAHQKEWMPTSDWTMEEQRADQITSANIQRKVPDIDYVCELNNRLWGCSSENHEIYACKLGDPDNWYAYEGLATDSYAVTVGSDGDFTGATRYNNTVIFFKENLLHKIIGTAPSNFQLNTTYTYGVQKGSSDSICTINEVLYYKSENAVCFYDGSTAEIISNSLGTKHYSDASGGTYNNKYYLSMKDDSGKWSLFVYDLSKGMWHREDDLAVYAFAMLADGAMCILTKSGKMWWVGRELENAETEEMNWEFTTGNIGYDSPDHKYLSRFDIRMYIPTNETLEVFIEYDSSGNWISKGSIRNSGTKSIMLPIVPRRCDHMKVKITGHSTDTRIYSIAKIYEQGSDG